MSMLVSYNARKGETRMIFTIDFNQFKNLIIRNNSDWIYVKVTRDEIGNTLYELWATTSHDNHLYTIQYFNNAIDAIMFENTYLLGSKVVIVQEVKEYDFIGRQPETIDERD
jgi:hypothetical protein